MALDPVADERNRQEYEAGYAYNEKCNLEKELRESNRTFEVLIAAGHITQEQVDRARNFVRSFDNVK